MRNGYATCLHHGLSLTTKDPQTIRFMGHSYHHYEAIRQGLVANLGGAAELAYREVPFAEFQSVHDAEYLRALEILSRDEKPETMPVLSGECLGLWHCLPGDAYGLGGLYEAIDQMKAGRLHRSFHFKLGSHHASAAQGHGYGIVNGLAAATRYAQTRGFGRVLMLDWDIHHGDGTQSIFANDPTVHCVSIHSAVDLYMAKVGSIQEGTTRAGERVGHTNLPLLNERFDAALFKEVELEGIYCRAADSLRVFQEALERLPWTPDLITVFSGVDSHKRDCGAGITNWETEDYRTLTQLVLGAARKAGCPMIFMTGGGYHRNVAIEALTAVAETLRNGSSKSRNRSF